MDVHLSHLADRQRGYVAWRQLIELGWSENRLRSGIDRGRLVPRHDGVFAVGHVPTDPLARYWAAVLTTPDSALSHHSAAAYRGFRHDFSTFVTIVRPGSGGPRTIDGLLVSRSTTLAGEVVLVDGLPVTSAARAIIDLAPGLTDQALSKLVREAIRTKAMTPFELHAALLKHRGRRGVARLRSIVAQYSNLQLERTKSDAEALAVVLLDVHARPAPLVNTVVAGYEADLHWPQHRLVIEIDGPQFHLFAEEDAKRDAAWRAAGNVVVRIPSDDVFDRPHVLLAAAPAPNVHGPWLTDGPWTFGGDVW